MFVYVCGSLCLQNSVADTGDVTAATVTVATVKKTNAVPDCQ